MGHVEAACVAHDRKASLISAFAFSLSSPLEKKSLTSTVVAFFQKID